MGSREGSAIRANFQQPRAQRAGSTKPSKVHGEIDRQRDRRNRKVPRKDPGLVDIYRFNTYGRFLDVCPNQIVVKHIPIIIDRILPRDRYAPDCLFTRHADYLGSFRKGKGARFQKMLESGAVLHMIRLLQKREERREKREEKREKRKEKR